MDTGYYEFHEKKSKVLLMLLGCLAFILAGCFFIKDPETRLIGYISVIFFGLCFIKGCTKLFSNKAFIEITATYIRIDNFEKLLWTDIVRVKDLCVRGGRSGLLIDVKDASKYKLTFSQKANLAAGFSPFYVALTALSKKDVEKLKSILKERIPENDLE